MGIAPRATLVLGLVAGCYSPPQPACGFLCGPDGACPTSYTCLSDQRCHLDGVEPMACVDGGVIPTRDSTPPPSDEPLHPFDAMELGPSIASISPADGLTGLPLDVVVDVMFSEPVQGVTLGTFTLSTGGVEVTASLTENAAVEFLLVPAPAMLMPNTTYTVHLSSAITDLGGYPLADFTSQFTTMP